MVALGTNTKEYLKNIKTKNRRQEKSEAYEFLLALFLVADVVFGIFLVTQKVDFEIVGVYFITAIITIFIYYYRNKSPKDVVAFWVHSAIVFHSIFGVLMYGWGYGIENLLIWAIATNYFLVSKRNPYSSIVISFEALLYLVLFLYRNEVGVGILDRTYKDECYIFICICIFASFLKRAVTLNSIHAKNFKNIQMQNEKVKKISEHDHLTGLRNRVDIEFELNQMIMDNKNLKNGKDILIAVGDIDDFKKINDKFGHNVGDEIIKGIAYALTEGFRANRDIVCRWGGEEFLIAALVADEAIAEKILQRSLKRINEIKTPSGDSVGMTFGVGLFGKNVDIKIDQMIKFADDLLYKGKESGKNRIEIRRWQAA